MANIPKVKITFDADFDELKKGVKGAQGEVEGFNSKMGDFAKTAGKAFAIAGAAALAYAGVLLVDGVKSAIEDEAAQSKLAATLTNVTQATKNQVKSVEDYITKTTLATGITDDELRPSLDRLVRSTKDVGEAQKLQTLALDIAAGTGKSLSAVSEALAKAHDGNFAALKKLGGGIDENILKSKDFDAATAALAATFEGQASKQAETFQGKMARLTVAFNEAKETIGSYILDALTPLVSGFVDKVVPAVQSLSDNLGKTLGPAFTTIFKVIKDDLLPILITWWKFFYNEIIPAIGKVVGPILEGLKNAFDKVKKALSDNSAELQPFLEILRKVWDFISKYLAPILGGTFKIAIEVIGTLVAGLVTTFSKFVETLTSIYNTVKKIIDYLKNNPITNFFDGGSKGLKMGVSYTDPYANIPPYIVPQGLQTGSGTGTTTGIISPATGVDIGVYSAAMQAAIIRREELKAETERLRAQRAGNASNVNITVNGAIDPISTARQIADVLNTEATLSGTFTNLGTSRLVAI